VINNFLLWATRKMPARAIDLDGEHYIERYHVVSVGKLEVVLHRYLGCDGDREVHDHPNRWCLGIPLVGGYTEERVTGFCPIKGWHSRYVKIRPWRWNFVSAMRWHRIDSVKPGTWTLFVRWDRFKSWSFAHKRRWSYGDPALSEVVISQPLSLASAANWQKGAQKGAGFRRARGTGR